MARAVNEKLYGWTTIVGVFDRGRSHLLRGHGGEAAVWGKDPLAGNPDDYQRIGVSFELPNHYQKLTGLENLRFFASLYDGPMLDAMELLDAVGLAGDANTRVGKYSKGMQMRLTFAWLLINYRSCSTSTSPPRGSTR